jgi:hypothetical protein
MVMLGENLKHPPMLPLLVLPPMHCQTLQDLQQGLLRLNLQLHRCHQMQIQPRAEILRYHHPLQNPYPHQIHHFLDFLVSQHSLIFHYPLFLDLHFLQIHHYLQEKLHPKQKKIVQCFLWFRLDLE